MPPTPHQARLHPTAAYTQPLTHDLDIFREGRRQKCPAAPIIDKSDFIISASALVKSTAEIKQITTAIKATHNGLNRLLAKLKPGVANVTAQRSRQRVHQTGSIHQRIRSHRRLGPQRYRAPLQGKRWCL
ncbi:MAG: hypothetical protein R3B67_00040 [Phycisphaerales bacterium]